MVRLFGVLTLFAMSCGSTQPVAPADPCEDSDAGRAAAEDVCRCLFGQQRSFYCYAASPDAGRNQVCSCVGAPDAGP